MNSTGRKKIKVTEREDSLWSDERKFLTDVYNLRASIEKERQRVGWMCRALKYP